MWDPLLGSLTTHACITMERNWCVGSIDWKSHHTCLHYHGEGLVCGIHCLEVSPHMLALPWRGTGVWDPLLGSLTTHACITMERNWCVGSIAWKSHHTCLHYHGEGLVYGIHCLEVSPHMLALPWRGTGVWDPLIGSLTTHACITMERNWCVGSIDWKSHHTCLHYHGEGLVCGIHCLEVSPHMLALPWRGTGVWDPLLGSLTTHACITMERDCSTPRREQIDILLNDYITRQVSQLASALYNQTSQPTCFSLI